MRLQPLPVEGDPQRLWSRCCWEPKSIVEHLLSLATACPVGAAALAMAMLPSLEQQEGSEKAFQGLQVAMQLGQMLNAQANCQWLLAFRP